MNNTFCEIKKLTFAYDTKTVLDIHTLVLERNKVYSFLGDNGSGKTTLLKIISGLLEVEGIKTSGCSNFEKMQKQAVYVHQNPLLLKGSVLYNIAFGLKLKKETAIERKVAEALETVGLKGFEKRKNKQLSGGEIQRIALARALVLKPKVLLLDEPTANVDKESVLLISKVLRKIQHNTTIIISSHDEKFAYHNSDEIIRLDKGKIISTSENVFKGNTIDQNEDSLLFKVNDVVLKCPAAEGNFNTAVVDFSDVILSNKDIETSARNMFKGKVVDISECSNLKKITFDIGTEISSLITSKSMDEFDIKIGCEMFLAFKTSAVKLY